MTRRRVWTLVTLSLLAGVLSYVAVAPPAGPRSIREFDPDRMADLELRMWQAYYAKERVRLFALLVTLLREQYHYSWTTATREAFRLARAAATFGDATSNYETVLPDLEAAYSEAKRWLRAGFDPREVAKAELAWWVARRTPGRSDPDQVGRLIAEEYALLYEAPLVDMMLAAELRAEAATMRDAQAARPDWPAISRLLTESYRQLRASLSKTTADCRCISPAVPTEGRAIETRLWPDGEVFAAFPLGSLERSHL
jgi:hypothetical protein